MKGFMHYQLLNYIRSLKMIPPLTIFCVWIIVLYIYKGVPILSSYAVTSITVYLIMTWLTMTVFSIEEESEKHILYVHLGNKKRYLWGKWATCFVFSFILIIIAIIYPIIMNNFRGTIHTLHFALAFYSHWTLALFGIFIGSLFSFSLNKYSWLSAVLVIVISLAYEGIVEKVSFVKWLLWLFPPVTQVLNYLNMGDSVQIGGEFWINIGVATVYSIIGFILIERMFTRRNG
ncbi:hypothetical protein M3589_01635 [Heyndrickxia oleronia]|uniref:hypothetical protein n=1 Tax=Heyndrickxia oleronia TaxID=38875 RepID=UPI0020404BB3|nr:hypothetical protein [Heyndrickxia oleronia]MCM3236421.1 hypothetical protein [Heyndrickxia oleronia]